MDWYNFSAEEKEKLLKSWAILEPNKQNLGCDIYGMIFNQCPEIRRLFPKMKFREDGRTDKKQNEFSFQALRFIQVIESAVTNIDRLQNLEPILDNLGKRHGKLELSGKFRSYYWSTFLECTIYQMRKCLSSTRKFPDSEVDEAIIQWRNLLRGVMKAIKKGYYENICHRLSKMSVDHTNNRKTSVLSIGQSSSSSFPENYDSS
ncbi:unnamed protein product [Auanema sp. JU1783]|nr:unnamed protein product [Auanema sp. JU1783]